MLAILVTLTTVTAQAQYYTQSEVVPGAKMPSGSCIVVVHNHTTTVLSVKLNNNAILGYQQVPVKEYYFPPGVAGYLTSYSYPTIATYMTDELGAGCDPAKPFVRHIHVYDVPDGITFAKMHGTNMPDPLEDFYQGLALGWLFVAFAVSVRILRRNLTTHVS